MKPGWQSLEERILIGHYARFQNYNRYGLSWLRKLSNGKEAKRKFKLRKARCTEKNLRGEFLLPELFTGGTHSDVWLETFLQFTLRFDTL